MTSHCWSWISESYLQRCLLLRDSPDYKSHSLYYRHLIPPALYTFFLALSPISCSSRLAAIRPKHRRCLLNFASARCLMTARLSPSAGMRLLPATVTAGEKCGNYADAIVSVIHNGGCYLVSLIAMYSDDWPAHSDTCFVVIAPACWRSSRNKAAL